MDRNERVTDQEQTFRQGFEALLSGHWQALPALFQGFTNNYNTCEAQPTVNGRQRQRDGTYKSIQMPKLVDLPIIWPGGGGATWTFPLTAGVDEGLVIIADRCIDQWWYNGFKAPTGQVGANGKPVNTLNDAPEFRIKDLSDGFYLPGLRSRPRAFSAFDPTVAALRNDDDTSYMKFDPVAKSLAILMPGGVNINGATISAAGEVTDALGKVLGTHTHPDPQGGNTGPPN